MTLTQIALIVIAVAIFLPVVFTLWKRTFRKDLVQRYNEGEHSADDSILVEQLIADKVLTRNGFVRDGDKRIPQVQISSEFLKEGFK